MPVDAQSVGYFPTLVEDTLLRGPQDSRSLGTGPTVEGPDTRGLIATDLFRYYDNDPDFWGRHQDFFRPINKGLGVFAPHDAVTIEDRRMQHVSLTADADLNLLTREFNPDLAMIKAGPLYFDILWAGAGVIYSDYNGHQDLTSGDSDDDGWIAYAEVGVRGLLRLSDSIYISAVANVIYLPFENELGLRFGNGANSGALLRLNITEQIGEWEIILFDEFQGRPGLEFFVDADAPAFDRAGRYSFGFYDDRSNEFYDRDSAYFVNTIGLHGSRPLFDNQWRLGLGIEHSDFWRTFRFDEHNKRDWGGAFLQYEGSVIPFAPRFSYQYYSYDGYNSFDHLIELQLTGRLTENVMWLGKGGYLFTTGDRPENNSFLWEFALDHTITRSTHHWITMGESFVDSEFVPDTRTAKFVRYAIDQRITSKFHLNVFAQYSDNETSHTDRFEVRDRFGAGVTLFWRPLDFTSIQGTAYYEQVDQVTTNDDSARWLYRVEATQQLSHRLTGNIFYQYEEMDSDVNPFTEHFMGVSLRRYF